MDENKNSKTLNPLMMQQYYIIQQYNKDAENVQKLKEEFLEFNKIKKLDEARKLAYKTYSKFSENKSFVDSGVRYTIYDGDEVMRLMGIFPDEIICFEFV